MSKNFIMTLLILGGIIVYSLVATIFASSIEIIPSVEVSLPLIQRNCLIGIVSPSFTSDLSLSYEPPENLLRNRAIALDGQWGGQCVYFVQQFLDIFKDCINNDCQNHPFRGYAGNIKPNSIEPKIGSAIIFNSGHVAVIMGIYNDKLELVESNYNFDEIITTGRVIDTDNAKITGYYEF